MTHTLSICVCVFTRKVATFRKKVCVDHNCLKRIMSSMKMGSTMTGSMMMMGSMIVYDGSPLGVKT